jgi:hypothetical protein
MPSTGNKFLDFFVFVILIVVCVIVLFRVLDIFDDEAGDPDGAFYDPHVMEIA